jgi:hypothetical protein
MIRIPVYDPSSISIKEKMEIVKLRLDEYKSLTEYNTPIGYINFVLPGFVADNALMTPPISPYLVDASVSEVFYDKDIMLYINYFGSRADALERLDVYQHDYAIRERRISPSWRLVVFFAAHTIGDCIGMEKFNMKYGLQLIGSDITLANIEKYHTMGIKHFNLVYMNINKELELIPSNPKFIEEVANKFTDSQFLVYSTDSDKLDLPINCRLVVGNTFWKMFTSD